MNYYNQTQDYYNYVNNTYNQPLYNQKANAPKKIYDPYNGFIRGNMFPELYNGYKLNKPLEITPLNEQADMLTYIDSLCFAMIDINLYLDLYPSDTKMIELFNSYQKEKEEITREYESKYGPLTINSNSLNKTPWAWDNGPWPWEGV